MNNSTDAVAFVRPAVVLAATVTTDKASDFATDRVAVLAMMMQLLQ
jgi:hypothetical protein